MHRQLVLLTLLIAAGASTDTQFRVRQMTRKGVPPGKGQCDIRLQIDGSAEVSLHGDVVSVHNIEGQDARDDGSECNAPLTDREVASFAFEVTSKRGEIRLQESPSRANGFTAKINIHAAPGGFARYAFRLTWLIAADRDAGARPGMEDRRPGGLTWNNVTHFGGHGSGDAALSGFAAQHLSDATADVDRAGKILVTFHTGSGPINFSGLVSSWEGATMKAAVTGDEVMHRLSGPMYIYFDVLRKNITRITFEGGNGQEQLHLKWDSRRRG